MNDNRACQSHLSNVGNLIRSDAFIRVDRVEFQACVMAAVIYIDAVLSILARRDARVSCQDDVEFSVPSSGTKDLTGLFSALRNVVAHPNSRKNEVPDAGFFAFNTQVGRGLIAQMGDIPAGENPFTDDVAVFWGPNRLLIKRNLVRAHHKSLLKCTQLFNPKWPYAAPTPMLPFSFPNTVDYSF